MTWVFGEAWRNVLSGTTHALRYGLVLAALLAGTFAFDTLAVDAIVGGAIAYRNSGAATITVQAPGNVDAAACDALSRLPGVTAAGALRADDHPLIPAGLPGSSIAAFAISPGAVGLFDVRDDTQGAGIVLSADAAARLTLSSGDTLATTGGSTAVRAVFAWPDDGRRADLSFAALLPTVADAPFDECWVAAWPPSDELAPILWSTVLPGAAQSGQQPMVSAVNTTLGAAFDGGAQFRERTTRHLPWVLLAAAFALGYVATRNRRLELASAQHGGVSRTAQLVQILTETCVWLAAGSVIAAGCMAAVIAIGHPETQAAAWRTAAQMSSTTALATLTGTVLACALTRERHLFRYFKTR